MPHAYTRVSGLPLCLCNSRQIRGDADGETFSIRQENRALLCGWVEFSLCAVQRIPHKGLFRFKNRIDLTFPKLTVCKVDPAYEVNFCWTNWWPFNRYAQCIRLMLHFELFLGIIPELIHAVSELADLTVQSSHPNALLLLLLSAFFRNFFSSSLQCNRLRRGVRADCPPRHAEEESVWADEKVAPCLLWGIF